MPRDLEIRPANIRGKKKNKQTQNTRTQNQAEQIIAEPSLSSRLANTDQPRPCARNSRVALVPVSFDQWRLQPSSADWSFSSYYRTGGKEREMRQTSSRRTFLVQGHPIQWDSLNVSLACA